jgi:D-alanine-D-alanine ligase
MDKALTKQLYQQHNIPTTKFVYFYKKDWLENKDDIINRIENELSWPVFVKPVHLGSSIGIAKLKDMNSKDLEFRIEVALHYDNKVLVEESVENLMDVTCCVVGNENLRTSLLQETVFQAELLDFEEKYITKGGAQTGKAQGNIIIPARLAEETTKQIQEMAKQIFRILGCSGIARIDFLYNKGINKFYANEVNPLPGTLYHHLWKASGLELNNLLQELIRLAEERHEKKRQITHTFQSSVLKNLKGSKFQSLKLR